VSGKNATLLLPLSLGLLSRVFYSGPGQVLGQTGRTDEKWCAVPNDGGRCSHSSHKANVLYYVLNVCLVKPHILGFGQLLVLDESLSVLLTVKWHLHVRANKMMMMMMMIFRYFYSLSFIPYYYYYYYYYNSSLFVPAQRLEGGWRE